MTREADKIGVPAEPTADRFSTMMVFLKCGIAQESIREIWG